MLKRLRFVATLVCFFLSFTIFAEGLIFINDDLRTGLNRAGSEGKLIFLEFSASYCTPCKMMDEYTFTNPSVIQRMNAGYIPVKIDIQTFDGFDLKNQYNVKVLPTILILDSKGRQVARYEETMAPTQLTAVLDKHNAPKNRVRTTAAPAPQQQLATNNAGSNNASNRQHTYSSSSFAPEPAPAKILPASYNTTQHKPIAATPPSVVAAPVKVQSTTSNTAIRKPIATTPTATGTTDIGQQKTMPTMGYTIQAGAYGMLTGVKAALAELKSKSGNQKQYYIQSKANGKTTYRVFVGSFATAQEADAFRKRNAIEGFVRNFKEFNK